MVLSVGAIELETMEGSKEQKTRLDWKQCCDTGGKQKFLTQRLQEPTSRNEAVFSFKGTVRN